MAVVTLVSLTLDDLSRYGGMSDQPAVRATGEVDLGLVTILLVATDPGYDLSISSDDFVTATREKEAWGNGLSNPVVPGHRLRCR